MRWFDCLFFHDTYKYYKPIKNYNYKDHQKIQ